MSLDFAGRDAAAKLDFSDLIEAARDGALAPGGAKRKSQKKGAKQRLVQASMLAPLLATEGCFTIGGNEGPIRGRGEDSGPGGPAPETPTPAPTPAPSPQVPPVESSSLDAVDDEHFQIDAGESIMIAADDLLANDIVAEGASAQLVRVFGATNGTVTLHDGVVHFTPTAGFEGDASFQYEIRDSNGNLSQAQVDLHVGPHDDMPGEHDDGGMDGGHGGHDDGGADEGGHGDHGGTPAHMAALFNLVPVSEATHVAVNNGSWFDPNTWASGEVPGDGAKVVIPEGVTVDYDGESPVSLFTVRVDGELDFATDRDTFMEVDTFVVSPSGKLTIGTVDNPVAANVETVIQFADNGPIDVSWDPQLLSRGLLTHGDVQIHGAEKETFLKVAADPMAGDTSLTLEGTPEGWQVGDKLVLTGTHLTEAVYAEPTEPRHGQQTEDEELIITRIEGNTIYFDKPLEYDHEGARADLKAYVANYTRNIRFETENADSVPIHQRGHTMFMQSDRIDVRYAEFYELGRTDKSERAFDVESLDNVESDSNIKTRYSMHLHRAGVDDIDNPAMVIGNSVWGSPGWGYVHHDSNAVMTDNAAYDVYGAAFVAETGNEIGRWSHNIAIKSIGNGGGAKWHEDVAAFDLGRSGAGFWFQGRLVEAVDNVAAGVPGGHGFVYMSRDAGGPIDVTNDTAHMSEALRYTDETPIHIPAISSFSGNEAFAVGVGLEVIKPNSQQYHDVRSVIDDFTGWEVGTGIHLQYTAHYTLKDIDLLATDGTSGGSVWRGIEFGPETINMVINGATIEGFPTGVHLTRDEIGLNFPFDGNWGYVFIDVDVRGATTDIFNTLPQDTYLTRADLVEGRLDFDSDIDGIPKTPVPELREYLDLTGTRTDEIGTDRVSPTWDPIRFDYWKVQNAVIEEGYWTLPDGRKVTVIEQYVSDRATGAVDKFGVVVEWQRNFSDFAETPKYNGVLDLSNDGPTARTDFATVGEGDSITLDVLSNDYDSDGDALAVDGYTYAKHGSIFQNEDGTLTYLADENYSGTDEFWYWVEDENGNFAKGHVQVTVEI
ncbi:Ig-like domain-containing protein [Hyphococcus sp.]|uniref:Ig-like domain-containing protein n=1 Tax=Hyphococcus sp. TaxID=2038636 RepID=UPI0035C6D24F